MTAKKWRVHVRMMPTDSLVTASGKPAPPTGRVVVVEAETGDEAKYKAAKTCFYLWLDGDERDVKVCKPRLVR